MRVHKYSIFIMNRRVICCMLQKILVFILFKKLNQVPKLFVRAVCAVVTKAGRHLKKALGI